MWWRLRLLCHLYITPPIYPAVLLERIAPSIPTSTTPKGLSPWCLLLISLFLSLSIPSSTTDTKIAVSDSPGEGGSAGPGSCLHSAWLKQDLKEGWILHESSSGGERQVISERALITPVLGEGWWKEGCSKNCINLNLCNSLSLSVFLAVFKSVSLPVSLSLCLRPCGLPPQTRYTLTLCLSGSTYLMPK